MSKDYYIVPIFVPHEGCPHDCVFCNQDKITGRHKESLRVTEDGRNISIGSRESEENITAQTVKDTVKEYLETIKNKDATIEVSFFGGTFTGIREGKQIELLGAAKELKDKGLIHKIRLSTRPDYINDHILTYLKQYEADIIELGVQSLDSEILLKSGRGHGLKEVEEASALIKKYGFTLGHQIMPGLPGDTFEKDIETVKKSIEMKPDICRIYPTLTIKGTAMEIMYKRGEYKPYTLEEAVEISRKMYKMYKEAGVNVIRIGLQPTETISDKEDVIAGPFHPAFRELVEGSLIAELVLKNVKEKENIKIHINPKDISKLYAGKKRYFNKIKENGINADVIQNNSINRGELELYAGKDKFKLTY